MKKKHSSLASTIYNTITQSIRSLGKPDARSESMQSRTQPQSISIVTEPSMVSGSQPGTTEEEWTVGGKATCGMSAEGRPGD